MAFHGPMNHPRSRAIADRTIAGDRDLSRDLRMMVPVFFSTHFAVMPSHVQVFDGRGREVTSNVEVKSGFKGVTRQEPVVAELYVHKLLDRAEFRALCDRAETERPGGCHRPPVIGCGRSVSCTAAGRSRRSC